MKDAIEKYLLENGPISKVGRSISHEIYELSKSDPEWLRNKFEQELDSGLRSAEGIDTYFKVSPRIVIEPLLSQKLTDSELIAYFEARSNFFTEVSLLPFLLKEHSEEVVLSFFKKGNFKKDAEELQQVVHLASVVDYMIEDSFNSTSHEPLDLLNPKTLKVLVLNKKYEALSKILKVLPLSAEKRQIMLAIDNSVEVQNLVQEGKETYDRIELKLGIRPFIAYVTMNQVLLMEFRDQLRFVPQTFLKKLFGPKPVPHMFNKIQEMNMQRMDHQEKQEYIKQNLDKKIQGYLEREHYLRVDMLELNTHEEIKNFLFALHEETVLLTKDLMLDIIALSEMSEANVSAEEYLSKVDEVYKKHAHLDNGLRDIRQRFSNPSFGTYYQEAIKSMI